MLDEEQALKLKEMSEFEGVLRRVWWEGLDYVRHRKLTEGGLEISRDVWLVEHGIRGQQEFNFAAGIVGFLVFLTIAMSIKVGDGPGKSRPGSREAYASSMAASAAVRPRSMISNASASCSSVMHRVDYTWLPSARR